MNKRIYLVRPIPHEVVSPDRAEAIVETFEDGVQRLNEVI